MTDGPESAGALSLAPVFLADSATEALQVWLAEGPYATVLLPLGSTEPHGPHLPISVDTDLSVENAVRAAWALRSRGVLAFVAPAVPYGVTDFALGFRGAVGVAQATLTDLIVQLGARFLGDGFTHLCLINHHLETGQIEAIGQAHARLAAAHGPASVSSPRVVSRRWGGRLGAEFRSGACHAGHYETSLMLAGARAALVQREVGEALPALSISLSEAMKAGVTRFTEVGMDRAYTGDPGSATPEAGEGLWSVLTEMVLVEVLEAHGLAPEG